MHRCCAASTRCPDKRTVRIAQSRAPGGRGVAIYQPAHIMRQSSKPHSLLCTAATYHVHQKGHPASSDAFNCASPFLCPFGLLGPNSLVIRRRYPHELFITTTTSNGQLSATELLDLSVPRHGNVPKTLTRFFLFPFSCVAGCATSAAVGRKRLLGTVRSVRVEQDEPLDEDLPGQCQCLFGQDKHSKCTDNCVGWHSPSHGAGMG